MQQLTLQFEGYADEAWQPKAQGTAKQCRSIFYKAFQHFFEGLQKSVTKPSRKFSFGVWLRSENRAFSEFSGISLSNLQALQGTAAVAASFMLMFTAAMIGG